MKSKVRDPQEVAIERKFTKTYSYLSSLPFLAVPLVLYLTSGLASLRPEKLGVLLSSLPCLLALVCYEFFKVGVSKQISGHAPSLSLPLYTNAVRGDPSKGPYLRRIVLRFKKVVYWLKPYQKVLHSAVTLTLAWTLAFYVIACFGAPLLAPTSDHISLETVSFAALVTILAALPVVIILGPERSNFSRLLFETSIFGGGLEDPLGRVLCQNLLGACVGAWAGAWPIPLDWDRPWQAWPITCVLGAVFGYFLAGLNSLWFITRLDRASQPSRKNSSGKVKRR